MQATIGDITYTFIVNPSTGRVTWENGTLISENGGYPYLTEFIDQLTLLYTINEYTITLNHEKYRFNVNGKGKVWNAVTGEVLSETGGKPYLDEWIRRNTLSARLVTI